MGDGLSELPSATFMLGVLVAGGFAALAIKLAWGATQWGRKTTHRVGKQMENVRAVVAEWSGQEGRVRAGGEIWRAVATETFTPGDKVVVTRVDGLTLEVRKK
jgi:membrane-bound serine protease (ClpP class)